VRLAIVAAPPLALTSIVTLGLALWPHHAPPVAKPRVEIQLIDVELTDPTPRCETAHELVIRGHVTGGASHVQLAGPVIYTDVTTNALGTFELRVPVDGDVCSILREPSFYTFGDDVSYTISFE
jgi:hypothetical protein